MKDSPSEDVLSLSGNDARKLVDDSFMALENLDVLDFRRRARWEPQEKGTMNIAASFPSVMKPRFNGTSRSKETPQRCY